MTTYVAQRRENEHSNWISFAPVWRREHSDAASAAFDLQDEMQKLGFRFSELHLHRADLAKGDVLTADKGAQLRVIKAEDAPEYPKNAAARQFALQLADVTVAMAKDIQEMYDAEGIPWGAYNALNIALEGFNGCVLAVADRAGSAGYKEEG